ncbi:MAG: 4Fe-4S ferredoxin, partial [Desulfobacterales bacterium]|nr:4Fe-4S ferredoxin [Desulfobacterales bacterium]
RPGNRDFNEIPVDLPIRKRPAMPELGPAARKNNFSEVVLGFDEHQVASEANRCLQCGVCAQCLQCIDACGEIDAIRHGKVPGEIIDRAGVVIIADPGMAPDVKGGDVVRAYGPKAAKPDINAMIQRGFAASARAMVLLGETSRMPRGRGVSFSPPDPGLAPEIRVGVFTCRCNDSFGWMDGMDEYIAGLSSREEIVHAETMTSACVPEGASRILNTIREKGITRVVLASCVCCPLDFVCGACTDQRSRLKDVLFTATGVSRAMVETCNLRGEVLRLVEKAPDVAMERFSGLMDRSIKRAAKLIAFPTAAREYNFTIAVIGETEAGLSAARTLADAGLEVFLFGTSDKPVREPPAHPNIHAFEGAIV